MLIENKLVDGKKINEVRKEFWCIMIDFETEFWSMVFDWRF